MEYDPTDLILGHKYHPSLKEEKHPPELFVEPSDITVEFLHGLLSGATKSGFTYSFKDGKTFMLLRFGDHFLIHRFEKFLPKAFNLNKLTEGMGLDMSTNAETAYVAYCSYIHAYDLLNKF